MKCFGKADRAISLLARQFQREPEFRPLAEGAGNTDLAAHQVDELFRNGQSETTAPMAAGNRLVGLTEPFE